MQWLIVTALLLVTCAVSACGNPVSIIGVAYVSPPFCTRQVVAPSELIGSGVVDRGIPLDVRASRYRYYFVGATKDRQLSIREAEQAIRNKGTHDEPPAKIFVDLNSESLDFRRMFYDEYNFIGTDGELYLFTYPFFIVIHDVTPTSLEYELRPHECDSRGCRPVACSARSRASEQENDGRLLAVHPHADRSPSRIRFSRSAPRIGRTRSIDEITPRGEGELAEGIE